MRIFTNKLSTPKPNHRKSERGQSLVEMAGSLLFLLLLASVVIDVGWAFYTLTTLRDTVQEASSYAAICPFESDNTTANTELIKERFKLSASAPIDMNQISDSDISVVFFDPGGSAISTPVMGGSVRVRVTMQHEIMVPFLGAIIGTQTYPLTVDVTNTVMRSKYFKQCDDSP
jgi:Flp pilus assembly protein TadG